MLLPLSIEQLCQRLERAQANQNAGFARAMARFDPASQARVLDLPGGIGVFLGEGHFLNQGLALGLGGRLSDTDLDDLESLLGQGGHSVVIELTPGAEAGLSARLASRGYIVQQFQQVWWKDLRAVELPALPPGVEIRTAKAPEIPLYTRLVMAGFGGFDELPPAEEPLPLPPLEVEGTTLWVAWIDGRPAAGGTLGLVGDTATLSGAAVLPCFRGQGLQRFLVGARLAHAKAHGAELACSATAPWSASSFNLETCGFRVAYPKLEMVRKTP